MLNRVNKVFIGKNIARTAGVTVIPGSSTANTIAQGEIVVLDKNKQVLAAGSTIADTGVIYIAEGLVDTYSIVNTAGTSITGIRKVLYSDPIDGLRIRTYSGRPYNASTEEVWTLTFTTNFTPVVGATYKIRIIYTDTYEKPGQVTATYNVTATTAYTGDLAIAFRTAINADVHARVIATGAGTTNTNDGTLILTGRVLPYDVTDTVNAIDVYQQVVFKVTLYSNNFGTSTSVSTTTPKIGEGIWQRVRDDEKLSMSNQRGPTNFIWFPILTPVMRVDSTATYNTIVIEHDGEYLSSDSQYRKSNPKTTTIYMYVGASQTADVLAVLNPWMSSVDNFNYVTF